MRMISSSDYTCAGSADPAQVVSQSASRLEYVGDALPVYQETPCAKSASSMDAATTLLEYARSAWKGREDHTAFTFLMDGTTTSRSFRQEMSEAMAFASEYQRYGLVKDDIVIIIAQQGPKLVASFLGALMIGAIPSFMPSPSEKQDPKYYWESHAQLFQRIKARLLVTDLGGNVENDLHLQQLATPTLDLNGFEPASAKEISRITPHEDEVAFLQHSSGTTSLKKGVALSHRAVLSQIRSYSSAIGMRTGQTVVSWLPLYHDMGLIACFILPLLSGVHVVTMCPFAWVRNPSSLLDALEVHQADYCWMPNFAFNLLALTRPQNKTWKLGGVKAFINCSEPCKADTFRQFAKAFADCGVRPEQLQVCYAMAESVYAVTQTELNKLVKPLSVDCEVFSSQQQAVAATDGLTLDFLPVGRAIQGMQIRILTDEHEDVPDEGRVGEIAIGGSSIFDGYYLLPDETRARRVADWHLTGDLGFMHQGTLYVTGRKGDVIVVRGKKFHGFDIEHAVTGIPGTKPGRSVAFGVYNPESGSEDAILVSEMAPGIDVAEQRKLRSAIRRAVYDALGFLLGDVHLVPPRWIVKTTSGKISRHLNAEKYKLEKERHV